MISDLTDTFGKSRDWDELVWAWKGWRDATGKHMRKDYADHIPLMNKEARLSGMYDLSYKMTYINIFP